MATMNIKDPRVHELAHTLAQIRGTSATAAVRGALEEALGREQRTRAEHGAAIDRLQARAAETAATWLDEKDLYDESGLPR